MGLFSFLKNLLKNEEHSPSTQAAPSTEKQSDPLDTPVDADANTIASRLAALGELATSEFYRHKKHPEYFTREDMLRLEAMERSAAYARCHDSKTEICADALMKLQPSSPVNLEPKEILFLWYICNRKISTEKFNVASYWTHKYNLHYQQVLEKLFSCGYLTFCTLRDSVALYTLPDIKGFLKDKGLPVTGNKQVLIDRICEQCTDEEISSVFSDKAFKATSAGEQIIAENEHIIYFHQHSNTFNVSIEQVDKAHKENPQLDKYELALKIFTEQGAEHLKAKNYGLYGITLHCKSIVYHDIQNEAEALSHLLQLFYLDYNGYSNGYINKDLSFVAPGIVSAVRSNPHFDSCSTEEFRIFFEQSLSRLPITITSDSVEQSYKALSAELAADN